MPIAVMAGTYDSLTHSESTKLTTTSYMGDFKTQLGSNSTTLKSFPITVGSSLANTMQSTNNSGVPSSSFHSSLFPNSSTSSSSFGNFSTSVSDNDHSNFSSFLIGSILESMTLQENEDAKLLNPLLLLNKKPEASCSCEDGGLALSYCNDCQDYLCEKCVSAHYRVKLTKDHKIKPIPRKVH